LTPIQLTIAALAGFGAGLVNAIAGGGTLVSFPALMAIGLPAVAANITSTLSLWPGYLGATWAQRADLRGQALRLWLMLPVGAAGGMLGGLLLLHTREQAFRSLVPFLLLIASALLAVQDWVRAWLLRRTGLGTSGLASTIWATVPVAAAAIYGGYFGAGLSVIVLACLGLLLTDTFTRLNALKQAIALAANLGAVFLFISSGQAVWRVALVMAAGALAGGALGGRLAAYTQPRKLRWSVVGIGIAVAAVYFIR
jgi:uncharacterized membrane protein YfcA